MNRAKLTDLKRMRDRAEEQYNTWRVVAFDREQQESRGKTQLEAVQLANYFEGLAEGYTEAVRLMQ